MVLLESGASGGFKVEAERLLNQFFPAVAESELVNRGASDALSGLFREVDGKGF
jgi:hypothetical protein